MKEIEKPKICKDIGTKLRFKKKKMKNLIIQKKGEPGKYKSQTKPETIEKTENKENIENLKI